MSGQSFIIFANFSLFDHSIPLINDRAKETPIEVVRIASRGAPIWHATLVQRNLIRRPVNDVKCMQS